MTYLAIRCCPHCGQRFTGRATTQRQAAADAIDGRRLHIKRKHPTKAQAPAETK